MNKTEMRSFLLLVWLLVVWAGQAQPPPGLAVAYLIKGAGSEGVNGLYINVKPSLYRHSLHDELVIESSYVMLSGKKLRAWTLTNRTAGSWLYMSNDSTGLSSWRELTGASPSPHITPASEQDACGVETVHEQDLTAIGIALKDAGHLDAALQCLRRSLQSAGNDTTALLALGEVEAALGNDEAAAACFRQVGGCLGLLYGARLCLSSWDGRAGRLYDQAISQCNGRPEERNARLERAVLSVVEGDVQAGVRQLAAGFHPDPPPSDAKHEDVAAARAVLARHSPGLRDVIQLASWYLPHLAANRSSAVEVHRTLSPLLQDLGAAAQARAHLEQALAVTAFSELSGRDLAWAYQQRMQASTPVVYRSLQEVQDMRRQLLAELLDLRAALPALQATIARPEADLSIRHRFLLIYQGLHDLPVLLEENELLRAYAPTLTYHGVNSSSAVEGGRVRVGFLSSYFRWHSVGRLLQRVIVGLALQPDMEVYLCYPEGSAPSSKADAVWQELQGAAGLSLVAIPRDLVSAQQAVSGLGLQVLVLADVGMDQLTSYLAFARMAPVQVAFWGHPSTTGLESVDYYISSELFEDDSWAAQGRFSEQLVRFSSLSTLFAHLEAPTHDLQPHDATAASPGPRFLSALRPSSARFYVCAQMMQKLHPAFDQAIQGILSADANGTVVLLRNGNRPLWQRRLEHRLRGTLGARLYDRVLFLDLLPFGEYLRVQCEAHVALDPFPFGGGVTMLEAIACRTPFVTLGVEQTTPRLASGLARRMGLEQELVARTLPEYVSKAVALATEASAERGRALQGLREHADRALHDHESVAEWASFLKRVAA